MSVLVTSNIHQEISGLPYGEQPLYEVSPVLNILEETNIPHSLLDGQKYDFDSWVERIKSSNNKIVVVVLNEPYIQCLSRLKQVLEEVTIVVCTPDESLINTLVFDYGLDYVCFDLNGLPDLLKTASNAFAPFYDHVKGIAYKNGLGELSKNEVSGLPEVSDVVNEQVLKNYSNTEFENILTDFTSFKSGHEYDAFYLKLPSSKKAVKTLKKIIEEHEIGDNLFVYPSCDLKEDKAFYKDMSSLIEMSLALKTAGFFRRFSLKRKLGKLFS